MSTDKPDKAKVEEIYRLFQGLEQESHDGAFDQQLLEHLIECIKKLSDSSDPILRKLSTYTTHLNTKMTLRHFAGIAVPFERYLKRSVQDDDFMINTTDRDHLVTARVPLHFVIDNMRSAFNIGSIFRTADTLGAQKIWLTGYSPTPHQIQVERAALGATLIVEWVSESFTEAIASLKQNGVRIVALETTARSVDISVPFDENVPTAFVIGNERFGLEKDQLAICDEVRRIPTYGIKNSLNAATAAAIAGYEWRKQWSENHSVGQT